MDFETSFTPKSLDLGKTAIEIDFDWKKKDEDLLRIKEDKEEERWRYLWNACSPEEALYLVAEDMERKREEEWEWIWNKKISRPNAIREEKER